MSIFTAVNGSVTALDAAQAYGLKIGKNRRALCPWHEDHNPDLAFYGSRCHCYACGNGGDATALTAQIFGLTMVDAAKKLNADFGLHLNMDAPTDHAEISAIQKQRKAEQERHAEYNRQWSFMCDVVHQADDRLSHFPDDDATWDNPKFLNALKAKAVAEERLEMLNYFGEDAL